jgi:hypothetical protein
VLGVVDEAVGAIAGIVGADPTVPTMGDTFIVGTAAAELTPRLPVSIEPNGIPVWATPPDMVGVVDVGVGVDDAAMLLEPAPHIPDKPDVSSVPEVVEIPDVAEIPAEVDIPDGDIPDVVMAPDVAPAAGVAFPVAIAIPPPS